ncbi:MAG: ankyrin repeat protein [Ramlibacter sp.]|jgi:ankyrin repeat protein|nr:ankyrin repeat protein [Ramlibacter sp.]
MDSSVAAPPAFSGQEVSDLFEASAAGDMRRVTQVIESKGSGIVNFQVDPTGATPLLRAVEFKRFEVAKYLLSHGANVDPEDSKKGTPLMHAAYLGDTAMVELLLKAGADPNKQEARFGDTPLTFAAWKGHEQAVKLLLDAGASPATKTANGETARQLAEGKRFEGIVRLLDAATRPKSP